MKQNEQDGEKRRFILVQLPEKTGMEKYPTICEIGKERIRRAGAQIAAGDTGFHVFKPDRSDLDMVFEVMLKLGVPLSFPVGKIDVNGKAAYTLGEDCLLLVCLAPDLQPEDMELIAADYATAKAVIASDSFADDTATANAYYILRDKSVELKLLYGAQQKQGQSRPGPDRLLQELLFQPLLNVRRAVQHGRYNHAPLANHIKYGIIADRHPV